MNAQIPPGSMKITVTTNMSSIIAIRIKVAIKTPSIPKKKEITFLKANLKLTEMSSTIAPNPDLLLVTSSSPCCTSSD
jgi:hypothetical protein